MRSWLIFCVIAGGCGFRSVAAGGDTSDGGIDGSGSGSGSDNGAGSATDCFQRWFAGAPGLALSTPQELITTPSNTDDRDPWISADGLRLYFARNPGTHGTNSDIYLATRSSPTGDFTNPTSVDNLDTSSDESRASLSGGELLVIFSSNRTGGRYQLYTTTRNDVGQFFGSPPADQSLVATVNTSTANYFDPFLSKSGLKLYLAPDPDGGTPQQIAVATRSGTDQNFGAWALVPGINSSSGEADPAVSPDDRIIVFSSHRPAGGGLGATNLWYATRQSPTDDFGTPKLIPMVNSNDDDGDPMLSDDGCELYFASHRNGGRYHLFHAQVTK